MPGLRAGVRQAGLHADSRDGGGRICKLSCRLRFVRARCCRGALTFAACAACGGTCSWCTCGEVGARPVPGAVRAGPGGLHAVGGDVGVAVISCARSGDFVCALLLSSGVGRDVLVGHVRRATGAGHEPAPLACTQVAYMGVDD